MPAASETSGDGTGVALEPTSVADDGAAVLLSVGVVDSAVVASRGTGTALVGAAGVGAGLAVVATGGFVVAGGAGGGAVTSRPAQTAAYEVFGG